MGRHHILWFSAGVGITAVLCLGYGASRYVPAALAFGLLCFGCGILMMQFISFRKQEERSAKETAKSIEEWLDELNGLNDERDVCAQERLKLEEGWNTLDAARKAWEMEKDLAIRNEAFRLLEKEAARRGGEQIERDLNSM